MYLPGVLIKILSRLRMSDQRLIVFYGRCLNSGGPFAETSLHSQQRLGRRLSEEREACGAQPPRSEAEKKIINHTNGKAGGGQHGHGVPEGLHPLLCEDLQSHRITQTGMYWGTSAPETGSLRSPALCHHDCRR